MNIIEKIIQCSAEPPTKHCLWLNDGTLKYFGGTGWAPVGAEIISAAGLNIPTKVSDLENDTGFITSDALTGYALSADIPTLVSLLTNDSNYVTSSELESKGYQTAEQCKEAVADLIGSAPEALDTLLELANALGNDPNFATTMTTLIGLKLDTTTYETDKATFALKSEIPTDYVSTTDITNYLLTADAESTYAKITDLSNYVLTTTLDDYYTKSDIDSKVSELDTKITDVSNSVTEANTNITAVNNRLTSAVTALLNTLNDYVTNDTFSNTLADYAKLTDIPTDYLVASDLTDYVTNSSLQTTLLSYAKTEDLPDVSDMLTKTEAATTYQEKGSYLTEVPSEYITETELESKGYQTEELVQTAIANLVNSAPEALDTLQELAAALDNDPNFATTITTLLGQKVDTSTYETDKETFALKTELPTKTSELTNDSGYITSDVLTDYVKSEELPTKTSDLTNDSGYITSEALDGYAKTTDIPDTSDMLTKTEADSTYQAIGDYALKSELPVNVSELTNDAGYVTVPLTQLCVVDYDSLIAAGLSGTVDITSYVSDIINENYYDNKKQYYVAIGNVARVLITTQYGVSQYGYVDLIGTLIGNNLNSRFSGKRIDFIFRFFRTTTTYIFELAQMIVHDD